MSKHTPKPWIVETRGSSIGSDILAVVPGCSDNPVRIAHAVPFRNHEANARLMAAAPEMYAVLKSMESVDDDPMANGDPRRAALLAAIAKAEGHHA